MAKYETGIGLTLIERCVVNVGYDLEGKRVNQEQGSSCIRRNVSRVNTIAKQDVGQSMNDHLKKI
jgi:hypothetical protein